MLIGPTEAAWISKYSAIRQRIAYPKKPAIVMPEIGQKLGGPIRLIFDEDINPHGRRHIYSRRRLRELFESGLTFNAIAEVLGITPAAARKVVRKQGWKRE